MVNKNSNNFDNEIVDLVLEEYNPNVRKAEAFKNKLAEVKSKIISNINKNINHYRGIEICPTSMLVLKDGATHKIITLRCGAHRVYEITTPKKEGMTEIQILNSLLKMKLEIYLLFHLHNIHLLMLYYSPLSNMVNILFY